MAFARSTQPSFNFLTGEEETPQPQPRQPLKETFRQSQALRADPANEDLRAQINTLTYELETLKQERNVENLQHEAELRDAQNRADAEFRRASALEAASNTAAAKQESLARELREIEDRHTNEKTVLNRKVQDLQERNQRLEEDNEEARTDLDELERVSKRQHEELEGRHNSLQASFRELGEELERRTREAEAMTKRLSTREQEVSEMEARILELKAAAGDQETLAVIKRELSEQVSHIRKLESANRDQAAQLKEYRKTHKAIEVVEEEKRVLESKVRMMEDLRREIAEVELQRQILVDEKRAWTSYLDNQTEEGEVAFESPEDLARAFVRERLEGATMLERIGKVTSELEGKDDVIRGLEDEKAKLVAEMDKLRTVSIANGGASGGGIDPKIKTRLERQRTLAVKEVEYLRAQLKAMDTEEQEFTPESFDAEKSKRVQELEELVDEYRKELQDLHTQLSAAEERAKQGQQQPEPATGNKRPRTEVDGDADNDGETDRLAELKKKNRHLQDGINKLETANKVLASDLSAVQHQLKTLKKSQSQRVLQLRSNPTADAEALKLSTVRTLRAENEALLQKVRGGTTNGGDEAAMVPLSSLDAKEDVIRELEHAAKEREKRIARLKQLWTAKSAEFREAVASILGWKLDFMPNGRVRVTSVYNPGKEGGEEAEGNSIVFDGERGTMKVSGGERSVFAQEIRGVIEEWVEGRKCVPGFLAALTCEFWGRCQGG
ncbi:MAD-domain-containing protein [Saccharata proteae CBS 121410]|uniref:Spindle assembly checkpoint component MAD1 n=1 Tax=Saccharata proteae CBS 121410 TaxID=1314787 RepID=A0A9P4HQY8_9PEZI|nr:MAD-domain-containing protein [Saccharata proteae CBS 121410]